jgi:ribose-phosphate pyrophosphokinase
LTTVIGGPASKDLARKIAKKLDAKFVDSQLYLFPDGESKLTLLGRPKGDIIVVQSTPPPVDSNLLHLLSLISKAKQITPQVTAVIPYLCYMRQDIEFLPGEIVTSRMIAKLLKSAGTSRVITVDIHSSIAMNYFEVPINNQSAVSELALFFKKKKLKLPLIVAPDLFWSDKVKEFAQILDAEHTALNKQRDRKTGKLKIIQKEKMDLSGRDVILVDDMISTGTSMIKAAQYVKSQNCARIFAACTHALLVDGAEKKLKESGIVTIASANTISHKTNEIDVSDILSRSLE